MEPSFTPQNAPGTPLSAFAIPLAIIAGFALIALAIYFSGIGSRATAPVAAPAEAQPTAVGQIKPVDDTDYIKGNPNAPILIVEYSDYDCPFCKQFHETMNQIMDEYGVTGKVAWVYRQFPIPQLHPNAERISQAALCVGSLKGNDAFWQFSDRIFRERDINEPTNVTLLPEYAADLGITREAFVNCLESGQQAEKVRASVADAIQAGVQGTPHSFVVVGDQMDAINGAQPYTVVKQIIESLLGQLEGRAPAAAQ